ncbi:DUF2817 domain-containing protein [Colwellia sp. 6_MG-2023]|uniref:DUF2817 domain-containing protein n=1 Tax=Colwellia sp. 6_MG-2023 TaxID=3062676 RepID=UPI0026E473FD|nr:DUF2817 domain-containing protein [Colwellia sp. 6_MG-2023]MDO6489240.1 DUF2817 domain-containing protein [Colwellia sp. 6_MG-2023]
MSTAKFFSENYQEARLRFVEAASLLKANLKSFTLPKILAPDGSELCIDTAWVGRADAKVILLCISGTHGPEGFCGSAAQLQTLTDGSIDNLPEDVAVLFIHALNPYGFAYMSRYNENNVDLNRNWINFDDIPKTSALCQELNSLLPPIDKFNEQHFNKALQSLAKLLEKHGGLAVENALGAGQYSIPEGLGYGGKEREWSSVILAEILSSLNPRTQKIAYLDWHSLVRSGTDDMVYLCFNKTDDPLFKRCASWWGDHNIRTEAVAEKWNKGLGREGGRPERHGLVMWGVQDATQACQEVAGGVVEFTDQPLEPLLQKLENMRAMLLSRYFAHNRDLSSEYNQSLYLQSRELWAPSDQSWRELQLQHAQRIFNATLNGAAIWANETSDVETNNE